ncbi:MAG TPA: hypothetical protein VKX28_29370 [Xanthobacteraceae bacterium]|nr:hypothetical protein [Xanthobacteraceae bacterium]
MRHVLDRSLGLLLLRNHLLPSALLRRDVDDRIEPRRAAVLHDGARVDANVDDATVGGDVAPNGLPLAEGAGGHELKKRRAVLGRPDIEHAHAHELLAAVAVVRDRGGVDGEEPVRFGVHDPHRHRVFLEQQSKRFLPPLEVGDVDAHPDAAALGMPFLDAAPPARADLLFVPDLRPAMKVETPREPFLLAAYRFRIPAASESFAQDLLEGNAGRNELAGRVEHLGVSSIPQHIPVVGIEDDQPFGNDIERIEQSRVCGPRLGFGPLGIGFCGRERRLRLKFLGHVLMRRDPAAVRHGPVMDLEDSTVAQLHDRVAGFHLDRDVVAPGEILLGTHLRIGAGRESQLHDLLECHSRPDAVGIQLVHFRVAPVAGDQTMLAVEEAQPLRHVVHGGVEALGHCGEVRDPRRAKRGTGFSPGAARPQPCQK